MKDNNPTPTAEEKILDRHYQPKMHWAIVNRKNVLNAIHEITILKTKPLEDRIKELKAQLNYANGNWERLKGNHDKLVSELSALTVKADLLATLLRWIENDAYNANTCNTQIIVHKCREALANYNK